MSSAQPTTCMRWRLLFELALIVCLAAGDPPEPVERALIAQQRQGQSQATLEARWAEFARQVLNDTSNRARCQADLSNWLGGGAAPPPPLPAAGGIVLVTGTSDNRWRDADNRADIDLALNKRLYAAAHGYGFEFFVADRFARALVAAGLPRWEWAKIWMLAEAARRHPRAAWLVWLDHDTWINPVLAEAVALAPFLARAPPDRPVAVAAVRRLSTCLLTAHLALTFILDPCP